MKSSTANDQQAALNPEDGQIIKGCVIDTNLFVGRVRPATLFQIAVDPRSTEDKKRIANDPDLAAVRRAREAVQRLFVGAKAKNVESYAQYVVGLAHGADGLTPPIVLWSRDQLRYVETPDGLGVIQVPFDAQLVAIDGETQLAARHEAAKRDAATKNAFIPVVIAHGRSPAWARQSFHDINTKGVRPNAALAISMDNRDPITSVAREVEQRVFPSRVNHSRRQLGKQDTALMTITALRGACLTLAEGISGVKYGVKAVPVDPARLPLIRQVALEWFGGVDEILHAALEDRDRTLASAPPVLAAIGAMGHELLMLADPDARRRKMHNLLDRLRRVRWERGRQWEGIAGKVTTGGSLVAGGTKETAYQIFAALNDETSDAYARVRSAESAAA